MSNDNQNIEFGNPLSYDDGNSTYYSELNANGYIPAKGYPDGKPYIAQLNSSPQVEPFPVWATGQDPTAVRYEPLPTPQIMRKRSLFGIPLRSFLNGQELSDETIQFYINDAISEIEHTLDIYITPVTFEERQDYDREMQFWSFGYFKAQHSPILSVERFQLTFNNGNPQTPPLVDIPLEFIWVQPQEGTIQLVPAQGVTISGLIVSVYSGLGFHAFNSQAISNWPGAVYVKYRAGFEKGRVPALLVSLIENIAARKILSAMGPILFPYNSTSVGIDGTSQSVGTLGPAFLKNRMDDLEKIIHEQMEAAKGYYQKRFLVDYI